ncbi:hypothetical protein PENSPDRAFT_671864 [Peniophora sp. CONT]|nr:hypothetical protein PENSPDRAFT_671864 [Peniophora sp. CONT]
MSEPPSNWDNIGPWIAPPPGASFGRIQVVTKGRNVGLYTSWTRASVEVNGYSGAVYQGFPSWRRALHHWYYTRLAAHLPLVPPNVDNLPIYTATVPAPPTPSVSDTHSTDSGATQSNVAPSTELPGYSSEASTAGFDDMPRTVTYDMHTPIGAAVTSLAELHIGSDILRGERYADIASAPLDHSWQAGEDDNNDVPDLEGDKVLDISASGGGTVYTTEAGNAGVEPTDSTSNDVPQPVNSGKDIVNFWIDKDHVLHVVDAAGNTTLYGDPEDFFAANDARHVERAAREALAADEGVGGNAQGHSVTEVDVSEEEIGLLWLAEDSRLCAERASSEHRTLLERAEGGDLSPHLREFHERRSDPVPTSTEERGASQNTVKASKGKAKASTSPSRAGSGFAGPSGTAKSPSFVTRDMRTAPLDAYAAQERFFVVVNGPHVDIFELSSTITESALRWSFPNAAMRAYFTLEEASTVCLYTRCKYIPARTICWIQREYWLRMNLSQDIFSVASTRKGKGSHRAYTLAEMIGCIYVGGLTTRLEVKGERTVDFSRGRPLLLVRHAVRESDMTRTIGTRTIPLSFIAASHVISKREGIFFKEMEDKYNKRYNQSMRSGRGRKVSHAERLKYVGQRDGDAIHWQVQDFSFTYPRDFLLKSLTQDLERTTDMALAEIHQVAHLMSEMTLLKSCYTAAAGLSSTSDIEGAWRAEFRALVRRLISEELERVKPVLDNLFTNKARDPSVHASRRMLAVLHQELLFFDLDSQVRAAAQAEGALICCGQAIVALYRLCRLLLSLKLVAHHSLISSSCDMPGRKRKAVAADIYNDGEDTAPGVSIEQAVANSVQEVHLSLSSGNNPVYLVTQHLFPQRTTESPAPDVSSTPDSPPNPTSQQPLLDDGDPAWQDEDGSMEAAQVFEYPGLPPRPTKRQKGVGKRLGPRQPSIPALGPVVPALGLLMRVLRARGGFPPSSAAVRHLPAINPAPPAPCPAPYLGWAPPYL